MPRPSFLKAFLIELPLGDKAVGAFGPQPRRIFENAAGV